MNDLYYRPARLQPEAIQKETEKESANILYIYLIIINVIFLLINLFLLR